jgi:hypothetical protein
MIMMQVVLKEIQIQGIANPLIENQKISYAKLSARPQRRKNEKTLHPPTFKIA